jgi:hypothetical protein
VSRALILAALVGGCGDTETAALGVLPVNDGGTSIFDEIPACSEEAWQALFDQLEGQSSDGGFSPSCRVRITNDGCPFRTVYDKFIECQTELVRLVSGGRSD